MKKCNTENDDKSQTRLINCSVKNGLLYVKIDGVDDQDHFMNKFETVMALKIWKSWNKSK